MLSSCNFYVFIFVHMSFLTKEGLQGGKKVKNVIPIYLEDVSAV